MLQYDRLMNYRMPEVRQRIAPRDAALYALSVGIGQDPTDRAQLRFVEHERDLIALPSQALVLAPPPGLWTLAEETGIDAGKLVHGEQALVVHGALPVEGEVLSRTRIDGIVDKGPGKGALLYTTRDLIDVATDTVVSSAESTVFLRGDGGYGGPSAPIKAAAAVPATPPDLVVELPTRPEQALYYRLNGDLNPIHSDPDAAARAGFARPILHGLCTFGIVCHALVRAVCDYDPARLGSMRLRFTAPVMPGETIEVDIWRSGSFRARVAGRDAVAASNGAFTLRS